MRAFPLPSVPARVALTTTLLVAGASAQETPQGLLKQDAASSGKTDVASETFEGGQKDEADVKDMESFTVSAGGLVSAGNSRSESFTSATQLKLRRGMNQAFAAGAANFAQAATVDSGVEPTVENFQGKVRYDRFLAGDLAAFLGVSARRDRFQGLNLRLNIDPGLAYYFIDVENHQLWAEAGYDLQHDIRSDDAIEAARVEERIALDKSTTRHSARLFGGYENKLNERVAFTTGLEYIQSVGDTKNWRLNWDWALTSTLVGRLAAATTFSLRYDNNPLPTIERLDVITSMALVLTLL